MRIAFMVAEKSVFAASRSKRWFDELVDEQSLIYRSPLELSGPGVWNRFVNTILGFVNNGADVRIYQVVRPNVSHDGMVRAKILELTARKEQIEFFSYPPSENHSNAPELLESIKNFAPFRPKSVIQLAGSSKWMRIGRAARYFPVSPDTLMNWHYQGDINLKMIGGVWMIRESELPRCKFFPN